MSAARESGDRAAFLGRLRDRLAGGVPQNPAHPMPGPLDGIPRPRSLLLDEADLVGSFTRNATALRALVHPVDGDELPDALVADLVARHGVRRAVVSREPEARRVAAQLRALDVQVDELSVEAAAAADLGVTGAVGAIATTGTVVQDSSVAGGRTASLLPPTHLCVVRASTIVPTSAEVLRGLGERPTLPSNLVLVTGPSRSADIEQIIALGVHGPTTVELAVLLGA